MIVMAHYVIHCRLKGGDFFVARDGSLVKFPWQARLFDDDMDARAFIRAKRVTGEFTNARVAPIISLRVIGYIVWFCGHAYCNDFTPLVMTRETARNVKRELDGYGYGMAEIRRVWAW